MFDDIRQLIDTLLKVEALHAGATTPGERDAAEAAIERIKKKLEQIVETDPLEERQCTFSNQWSKQLFCALAKRYDLQPYRYHRQRHTTVMLRVPKRFLDEVLWPEFDELDDILLKYLDDITAKIISEAIFKGSAEEEVREQPLIESDVKETLPTTPPPKADVAVKPSIPSTPAATPAASHSNLVSSTQKAGRNDPCPCGSGRKFKKCCGRK